LSDDHFIDEITLAEARNIIKASMSILRNDEFPIVAKAVFHGCKDEIGAKAGYVALLSDDGSENEIVYLDPGEYECNVDLDLPMPIRGFREVVYLSGRAQYCNDFNHTDFTKFMPPGHVTLKNVMFAPLVIDGVPRGLLGLSNKDGDFTEKDARLAEHYGKLAALALLNSRNRDLLESSERKYRELFEGAFDAIAFLDEKNNIVFANKAFCEMFSCQDESTDLNIVEILGACEFPLVDGVHSLSTVTKGGQDCNLEVSISTMAMGDKGVKVAIMRDVSEKLAHEKMMNLIGRKMELMGKITRHDVMNHIMVLQGFLELSYDAGTPIKDKHYSRMNEALEKIKALYSLQREFENLGCSAMEWIDVNEAVSRAQKLLGADINQITVQVETKISLWADHLLEKVLYNLLHNSMVHGEKVSQIRLITAFHNGDLFLDFIDDGIGIPTEQKNSVFSLGFGKFSGQGLFLVREILATYNMSIEEIGEPDKGAVFRISVPRGYWMQN